MSINRFVKLLISTLASENILLVWLPSIKPFLAFLAIIMASHKSNLSHRQTKLMHKGLIRRVELALYRLAIVPLVAFLPAPLAYGLACLRGDCHYHWDASTREEIMRCVKGVLGNELNTAECVRVTRDFFRLRSCEAIDVMRLAGKGRALSRLVEIRGLEHIEAALMVGKGAIIASAHYGSFDSCFCLINMHGFPITAIGRWPAKADRNRSLIERFFFRFTIQKLVTRHRHRPNIEPRPGELGVAVQAATILRQNELVSICLDPPVLIEDRIRAIPMNFLSGQALLLPGAIMVAQLTGTPILMTFMYRSADWRHQVLEISPPVSLEGDISLAFRRCLGAVEEAIRRSPAHWLYWKFAPLVELGLLPEEAMKR